MLLTVLEAHLTPDQEPILEAAYAVASSGTLPPGLVRSQLLRDALDPTLWRIETLWASRAAVESMRAKGTPEGILMFRAAGAEPSVGVFDVVTEITAAGT